jgi:hypothetical protein
MKLLEKGAPAAAIVATVSTLACCVPLGFLGGLGLAGVSFWTQHYRLWLFAASIACLCVGSVQLYIKQGTCIRRSRSSLALFWFAVVLVILVALFPQVIASLIAD